VLKDSFVVPKCTRFVFNDFGVSFTVKSILDIENVLRARYVVNNGVVTINSSKNEGLKTEGSRQSGTM